MSDWTDIEKNAGSNAYMCLFWFLIPSINHSLLLRYLNLHGANNWNDLVESVDIVCDLFVSGKMLSD